MKLLGKKKSLYLATYRKGMSEVTYMNSQRRLLTVGEGGKWKTASWDLKKKKKRKVYENQPVTSNVGWKIGHVTCCAFYVI